MKRPTIRDVAARADVSHQTVSRVINEDRRVAPATRERVLAAIRELNFEPNAIARSLTSNRTHTIGIVTYNVSEYALGQTVAGAEAEARRQGYFVFVGSVAEAADEADEAAYLRLMLNRQVEGLILDWPTLQPEGGQSLTAITERVPMVTIAGDPGLDGVCVVDIDNQRGAFEASTYLIEQGHRAIATITGPPSWNAARARLRGYRDALESARQPSKQALVQSSPEWSPEGGRAAVRQLLSTGAEFTAIFAQSDLLALGAVAELRDAGLRVPEDVSIVGYDDIPVASYFQPPLTTMRQPIRDLGAHAARLLIDAIARRSSGELVATNRQLLAPQLVIRDSVAPLS